MKILIVGYYNHNNLGDDMFQDAFKKLLPLCQLTFIDIDNIKEVKLDSYDRIICGGGDIVNDYFLENIKYIHENFKKPIYACSLGIPYRELIQKNYLQYYDHVFVRNTSYLLDIQQVMGSQYTHYLPDIVMYNFPVNDKSINLKSRKMVGVFLASSLTPVINDLVDIFEHILKNSEYKLHFVCFDTSDDAHDDKINRKIASKLHHYKHRIITDNTRYTPEEMYNLISSFKFCICNRFHSHILSTLAAIPFIGIHYANKSLLYLLENNYPYYCPVFTDEKAKPIKINLADFTEIYSTFLDNLTKTRHELIDIANKNQKLLDSNVMYQIIKHSDKRNVTANIHFIDRVDEIYQKYKNIAISNTDIPNKYENYSGINNRDLVKFHNKFANKNKKENTDSNIISCSIESLTKNILFDITRETSSEYSYGMIENLKKNPQQLKEMIDWVLKDKREKILALPRVNLQSTSSYCFNGLHRSGWNFALNAIQSLHSPYAPILDVYCDASFGWCRETPCREFGIIPYTQLWCGIFHHTPNKNYTNNNIEDCTNTKEFIDSLPTCIGLFTLSEWLSEWLRNKVKKLGYDIIVETLYHPTSLNIKQFDVKILDQDKIPIVNVGAWLRDSYAIYAAKFTDNFVKYRLKGKNMDNYFPPNTEIDFSEEAIKLGSESINNCNNSAFLYCLYRYLASQNFLCKKEELATYVKHKISTVKVIEYLNDKEYDELLANNVCFLNLLECSAANTLIECIARSCPIIVNRIPPVVEYIGKDYPLLYDNLEELSTLVTVERIKEAHKYLQNYEIKRKLSSEYFLDSLYNSRILQKTLIN